MKHRRLKILFITPWYPTQEHPIAGVFVREHARAVQLYDDVVVFHCQRRGNLGKPWDVVQESDDDLTAELPAYRVLHRQAKLPNLSFLFELGSVLYGLRHMRRQGFRPDIVHGHTYTSGAIAVIVAKLLRIPSLVTEHSSEFPRKLVRGAGVWKARLAFRQAALVLPVSQALQRAIEAYGICARFQVVPNVVDTELFHRVDRASNSPKRLLTVASLVPSHVKGIPYLLHALTEVQVQRSDWHLDIVGDGPARAEYERLVETLNLTDYVKFHGINPKPQVAQFMQRADLFVLPSLWENLPCVLIEAMACGLPVVSTLTGGIPEIVDEDVGILVPPGDEHALAEALVRMLEDVDKWDHSRIVEKAQKFTLTSVGGIIDSLYRQVLSS
jgi:L-malate glycosyltransferase